MTLKFVSFGYKSTYDTKKTPRFKHRSTVAQKADQKGQRSRQNQDVWYYPDYVGVRFVLRTK